MQPIIQLNNLSVSFPDGERRMEVLRNLSFTMQQGEFLAITGPSGSGKSTLLSVIGTLIKPDTGVYLFDGTPVHDLDNAAQALFRNRSIGFIFQDHRLLPQFTAGENILLPALAAQKQTTPEQEQRADYLLKITGMTAHKHKSPEQLSGGECQRIAICRALIMRPQLLLADEPTGLLDAGNAEKIIDLLLAVNASEACSVLMVTHAERVAQKAKRTYILENGILS